MSHSFFSLTNVVILIMYIVINTKNRMMKKLLSFIVAIVLTISLAAQNNTISITYNDSTATVVADDDIAQYITPTISGAHVSIAQSSDVPTEIIYTLSGTSNDGEFYMSGSYKATIELNGLTQQIKIPFTAEPQYISKTANV